VIRWSLQAVLLAVLVSGCGGEGASVPDHLDGDSVARMAEHQLEVQNPRMAKGTLTCPDLDLRVGASVRCVRRTELSGGRVVTIGGTVSVTARDSGGRLHVAMDRNVREFGLAGEQLAEGVAKQYRRRFGIEPRALRCPYLRGVVGARVICRLQGAGSRHQVAVVVTAVDPATFTTTYHLDVRGGRR
jgi:hypothetical protein